MEEFDPDLSTLTNIRLQNRKSRQRLASALAEDDTTSPMKPNDNKVNRFTFLDQSTHSPLKNPSPLRYGYSRRDVSAAGEPKDREFDIDTGILNRANLSYLDRSKYDRDLEANALKRERILNLLSPDISTSRGVSSSPDRLRPHSIPGLEPESSPLLSSRKRSNFHRNNTVDGHLEMKDAFNDQFAKLVDKYNLSSSNDDKFEEYSSQVKSLKDKIKQLELENSDYKAQIAKVSNQDENLLKRNMELTKEINKLNEYIKFLDSNFQEMYDTWLEDQHQRQKLIQRIQDMKLETVKSSRRKPPTRSTSPQKVQLSPYKLSPPRTSPLKSIINEDTTELLRFS
ncbi:hypothetical protein BN1211_4561 [Cyberlindnera jadinii]|uniref:Uncharacterized protein n=1 Tax=Cyberlindnera jadinii (strain ATCC 18201 / CBS 1600 / BCRC 20928 / JCM 3617 / NBRC 0987 / NRRL Y-1542) TaxID=983966 RepID=A0A0H5CH46_CYBJN|nr:hypothetical protein BN1211_4561 [Cyberlindnera jadinii]